MPTLNDTLTIHIEVLGPAKVVHILNYPGPKIRRRILSDQIGPEKQQKSDRNPGHGFPMGSERRILIRFR